MGCTVRESGGCPHRETVGTWAKTGGGRSTHLNNLGDTHTHTHTSQEREGGCEEGPEEGTGTRTPKRDVGRGKSVCAWF